MESSNNSKEKDFSQSLKIDQENVICKDGFCTLSVKEENTNILKNKENFFDPI